MVLFECPSSPKAITISEDMSLDALRKTITYAIEGSRILLDLFYCQPVYVGNGYIEYRCMELKCDDDAGKMFFIFWNLAANVLFSSMQRLIDL